MSAFKYTVEARDKNSLARAGELKTPHGVIKTPNFNPVGTQATVKTLSAKDLEDIGAQIILANTYHLHLRPGTEVVEKMGGLAKFMGWGSSVGSSHAGGDAHKAELKIENSIRSLSESRQQYTLKIEENIGSAFNSPPSGESYLKEQRTKHELRLNGFPTMTDSGGFQVFSLGVAQKEHKIRDRYGRKISKFSKSVFLSPADTTLLLPAVTKTREEKQIKKLKEAKVNEDGVWFYSHIDGSKKWFDAQVSIKTQEKLGADLIVAFDDHESPLWDFELTKLSLERTERWGIESLKALKRKDQLMYGVVHGGIYEELRRKSAQFTEKYFPAISIGGSYTSKDVLYQVLNWVVPYFSEDKPRHLLGIGEVQDLFEAIERGMDFFDCVAPTRRGRHGNLYLSAVNGGRVGNNFTMQITNSKFALDANPIDPGCLCFSCQNFSRAYIRHLFMSSELLAQRLGSYHNVYFIVNLVKRIREAILEGRFQEMKKQWLSY